MYIDFDGHHSGGSSFDMYMIFDSVIRCGSYPQVQVRFKKKKSLSIWSRTPNLVRIRQSGLTRPFPDLI